MPNCFNKFPGSQTPLTRATTRRLSRSEKPDWSIRYLSLLLAFMVTAGCSPVESFPSDELPAVLNEELKQAPPTVAETPALDLNNFTTVKQLIPALAEKRAVFVGERHTRYDHHLIQLEIIRRLHRVQPQLAIGMESFQQPFQRFLDDYVSGVIDEQEMLRATQYFQRWHLDYRLYAPILRYAREHRLPVVALNPPVELTRKVGRVGLKGLSEAERARLPTEIDRSDAAYEARLKTVFEHHPNNDGQEFMHFLEVQLLWDEGMAERAADFLQENPDRHMVIVAGSGHLAYGSAIPARLTRRLETSTAIVLNSWEGPIKPGLADYLLFPEEQSLPPAGKMGAVLEEQDSVLKVKTCLDDSPCADAGLKAGDRLLTIDDRTIDGLADLRLALWNKLPGDTVSISILRKRRFAADKTLTHEMTLK